MRAMLGVRTRAKSSIPRTILAIRSICATMIPRWRSA
jgi:hypothetical protein